MGVFGDWAERYWDLGINVLPIAEDKKPPAGFTFKQWLHERQEESNIAELIKKYGHAPGIGLVCGEVSGICGFDFDYKYNDKVTVSESKWKTDNRFVDAELRSMLPGWTLAKKAYEGWTVFYKNKPHFKTIAVDRNGVRAFDFKASGYIVVPPSFHSIKDGKHIYYSWIVGDPLEEFKNLPELDFNIIKDAAAIFRSGTGKTVSGSRHHKVFSFARSLCKIEPDNEKLAQAMLAHDLSVNGRDPKGPYLLDKSYVGNDGHGYAVKWAERIRAHANAKGSLVVSKECEQDIYDYFFKEGFKYGRPKKDILSRKIFYKHPAEHGFARADEFLDSIKSYAISAGLDRNRVLTEFARFQEEYPAKDFLVDIPPHDGVDHLRTHVNALTSPLFSPDEIYEIMLNWGNLLFGRINDGNVQNRCIIFNGEQGMGKDTWISDMTGMFKPYYQLVDIADQSEMVSAVQKLYIAHLPEFDQSKKLDVAFIKALITNPSSFLREKYARVASEKPMHASWLSTINDVTGMLRDASGNRRFVVIPLTAVSFKRPKPGLKIIAQFKDAFERGLGQSVSAPVEAKISALIRQLTPEDLNVEIEQLFVKRLQALINGSREDVVKLGNRIESTCVADMVSDIARTFQVSVRRVYGVAMKYKSKSGAHRYYSPVAKYGSSGVHEDA